jgi:hypothetical protein
MIAAAVAGMAWAISSPMGSSPDEDYHLASIWCPPPAEGAGCHVQTYGTARFLTTSSRLVEAPLCYAYHADESGACIWSVPADQTVNSIRFDSGGYPGGFYHVMHIFASDDPYSAVYRMRAFNVGIAVALGALLVLGASRPTRRILAYAVASTYVPMGMFIVPAANPSSWAVMGLTTTAFALHSYWLAETRGRMVFNGVLLAAGVALAATSRTDAALYTILAATAVTLLHYRSVRRHPLRLILPGVIPVVGLITYLMSSQATVALTGNGLGNGVGMSGWGLLLHNLVNSPNLLLGNQGLNSLGWLDTPMPTTVSVSMVVFCGFLVAAGIRRLTWMKSLVTFGSMVTVVAIAMYVLQLSHSIVGEQVQPRYLLPLLPVVSLLLLTGDRPDQAVRLSRRTAWLAWGLVSLANSIALMVNIQRYTTGLDGPLFPGRTVEWWSTNRVGPLPTWILGSLGFAVAAWMIVRLSSGTDAPRSMTSRAEHQAIEPASLDEARQLPLGEGDPVAGSEGDTLTSMADVPDLARASRVAADEQVLLVNPSRTAPEAAHSATPAYTAPIPASQSPSS